MLTKTGNFVQANVQTKLGIKEKGKEVLLNKEKSGIGIDAPNMAILKN